MKSKSNVVEVKGIRIGEGQPKICVPITAENIENLKYQAKHVMLSPADIVEFRVDYMKSALDTASVMVALEILKEYVPEKPILFTFRTSAEGGEKSISLEQYMSLYEAAMESGYVDIIDVEYALGKGVIERLERKAADHGVKVILSHHNFEMTPPADEIVEKLRAMKDAGADIAKIALMPQGSADVLALLTASERMKAEPDPIPVVTISMSAYGLISRIAGEIFGSAVTFAAVGKSSAPGQIDADELDHVTNLLHQELSDAKRARGAETKSIDEPENVKNLQEIKNASKNIILVGFMGTGKSTIGRRLAQKTSLEVKELDDMVVEEAGMSISDIFARYGEDAFREMETEQVRRISDSRGVIVSCGGGTVLRSQNVEMLRSTGYIFLLRATPEVVYRRVRRSGNKRPLLSKYMSRGYISCMMKKRSDIYMSVADYVIDVDGKNSDIIADEIIKLCGLDTKKSQAKL